jgi:hypothetical protein
LCMLSDLVSARGRVCGSRRWRVTARTRPAASKGSDYESARQALVDSLGGIPIGRPAAERSGGSGRLSRLGPLPLPARNTLLTVARSRRREPESEKSHRSETVEDLCHVSFKSMISSRGADPDLPRLLRRSVLAGTASINRRQPRPGSPSPPLARSRATA